MIRNLNQMAFRGFGTIVPAVTGANGEWRTVHLESGDSKAFFAEDEVWITCGSGNSVLSVSADNRAYSHFYLDKRVCVRKGIYFALTSFQGVSSVEMGSAAAPKSVENRSFGDLKIENKLRIGGIHTFFYHEKEQGFLFPGESHPMLELTYVDQGTLHSVADGQDMLLKQGDIVLYGPNQWHMQYADIGVEPRYVTITFEGSGLDLTNMFNRRFTASRQAAALLQQMLREWERMDAYSGDMIIAQLTMLLITLQRQTASKTEPRIQTANAIHNENEIIRRAQIYVSTHIREKLSVPIVARQVDVSPSYLTALFHKNLQISPGEYIRRIKLQESKRMIRENNLNFTEIAAALQYSTVHHFSRQFKEKFGITPTEYAKSVR